MSYKISSDCVECDSCRPFCPTGAINAGEGQYWINQALCDNCKDYEEPQCVVHCPLSLPTPAQARRGRTRLVPTAPTDPDLFANGKNSPFASAIVIWEGCNVLSQRQSLNWNTTEDGSLFYQPTLNRNYSLSLQIIDTVDDHIPALPTGKKAIANLESFDIRAACLHLIYAAHATALERPWEQEFVLSDRQIEEYLGLDKRKDLSKPAKLTLIKEIAQQPCLIQISMSYPAQGRIQGFSLQHSRLWHLLEIQHHFQEDEQGCRYLVGLTFRIRAGTWAKFFLNKQGCKERTALYQYSILPKSLLSMVMSIWQQHEGAARMMFWLLFKVRLGREQRITVPTLMRIAYGEKRLVQAASQREERKRLLRTYESDLEVLNHYGLRPTFDPETYPETIQPLWAKLGDLPDDADEALEFWTNDGSQATRLTDASRRGKWQLLMNARILWFDLLPEWSQSLGELEKKKNRSRAVGQQRSQYKARSHIQTILTSEQIVSARKKQGLSQRELAEKTGKSQSWIRDIENGRFCPKASDQAVLRRVLEL